MHHICLWTSETHENGQKRCGSDEKVLKLGSFLGVQEQKAEQQSIASRRKEERERERNKPNVHFEDHSTFKKKKTTTFLSKV